MTNVYTFAEAFSGQQGDGVGILAEGIDLSHHNGDVDFGALKEAGISFVILRIGTSNTPDEKFEDYYAAARAAGLDIGVYFYTYAKSVAAAQADAAWVIEQLGERSFEYPIFFDIEDTSLSKLDRGLLTDIALAFCDEMVAAGYYPGVYTNKLWMAKHLEIERIREVYDIWLASWIVTGENISDYSNDYSMWQYTASAEVDGVATAVDRNGVYRDFPAWIAKFGYNNLERVG
jgi:GH25 family lysozyme M1 (1,4-beta-N-acetylmuramidase)